MRGVGAVVVAIAVLGAPSRSSAAEYFGIRVVDGGGTPVPCVTLTTTGSIALRTDAQGRVAFYEPGLMGTPVWLSVSGPHVQMTPDGFGYQGTALTPTEGGNGQIVVQVVGAAPCVPDDRETQRIARGVPEPAELFRIDVVDDETGRGVPLVILEVGEERWVSDSGGHVAFDPLGYEGEVVAAHVWSHGFSFADDGAIELPVAAGTTLEIEATRMLPAERLYRVTGGGIHRDALLLGLPVPLVQPAIAGLVVGQDSVFTAIHAGSLRWIWGDTSRPAYPLGNFHASGATSVLPAMDPELGVDLQYFVGGDGFSRAMAPTETVPGQGVTWLGGLVSVPDAGGQPRLHATFAMVLSDFTTTRFGMLAYDDANERFVEGVDFDLAAPSHRWPRENAFHVRVGSDDWVYYHAPVRVPGRSEALLDPSTYETFTPYLDAAGRDVERDPDGRAIYRWRSGGIPYPVAGDAALADAADQLDGHLVDVVAGTAFQAHENGSTEANDHTGRFVRLITPMWALGETWIAISDTPMGPWVYATQLVTHRQYTFYNPRHHREFDGEFGRRIYFEATYTNSFSGNPDRTPRYDYNQVMYAVDLDRPALALPVPIYTSVRGELGPAAVLEPGDPEIAADFFAPLGPWPGSEPVWWTGPSCEPRRLEIGGAPQTSPLFWALPLTSPAGDAHVELREGDGESPAYSVDPADGGEPIARVWRNPIRVTLPVADHLPALRADAGDDRCLAPGETLELSELDDAPPGGSAHWELDGAPIADGDEATPGLHMLARVLVRQDGFAVRDEAIVRIAEVPGEDDGGSEDEAGSADDDDDDDGDGGGPDDDDAGGTGEDSSGGEVDRGDDGCGCTTGDDRDGSRAWWGLLVVLAGARARRRRDPHARWGRLAIASASLSTGACAEPSPADDSPQATTHATDDDGDAGATASGDDGGDAPGGSSDDASSTAADDDGDTTGIADSGPDTDASTTNADDTTTGVEPPDFDALPWQTGDAIGYGVAYKDSEDPNADAVFIGYAGYASPLDAAQSWVTELWHATLQPLGVRHVFAVQGPADVSYAGLEIGNSHVAAALTTWPDAPFILVAAHSSGSYVAHELIGQLESGLDPDGVTADKLVYFDLDGGTAGLYAAAVDRLHRAYFVSVRDGATGTNAPNRDAMIALGAQWPGKGGYLELPGDRSGCQAGAPWCLHMVVITTLPHDPAGSSPADYLDFVGRPVATAYIDQTAEDAGLLP